MHYNLTNLAILFFCYSFLGWGIETSVASVKHKCYRNRRFLSGPFCLWLFRNCTQHISIRASICPFLSVFGICDHFHLYRMDDRPSFRTGSTQKMVGLF
mgnify:CR=1 FL=1